MKRWVRRDGSMIWQTWTKALTLWPGKNTSREPSGGGNSPTVFFGKIFSPGSLGLFHDPILDGAHFFQDGLVVSSMSSTTNFSSTNFSWGENLVVHQLYGFNGGKFSPNKELKMRNGNLQVFESGVFGGSYGNGWKLVIFVAGIRILIPKIISQKQWKMNHPLVKVASYSASRLVLILVEETHFSLVAHCAWREVCFNLSSSFRVTFLSRRKWYPNSVDVTWPHNKKVA